MRHPLSPAQSPGASPGVRPPPPIRPPVPPAFNLAGGRFIPQAPVPAWNNNQGNQAGPGYNRKPPTVMALAELGDPLDRKLSPVHVHQQPVQFHQPNQANLVNRAAVIPKMADQENQLNQRKLSPAAAAELKKTGVVAPLPTKCPAAGCKTFDNKVVIVTGATYGFGQAVSIAYAREGASIVIQGHNKDKLDAAVTLLLKWGVPEARILAHSGYLDAEDGIKELVALTLSKFSKIDVLVNCRMYNALLQYPTNWDVLFEKNFKSVVLLVEAVLPHIQASRGCIVNTIHSYTVNKIYDYPGIGLQTAVETALEVWAKAESERLARVGVRINNVVMGPFRAWIKKFNEFLPMEEKQRHEAAMEKFYAGISCVRRVGSVEDIVHIFLFLANNEVSRFVTGASWLIDGGSSTKGRIMKAET